MGYWGSAPWENDYAACWFDNLFQETGLLSRVEKTLQLEIDENTKDEIWGAIMLFISLGRMNVYSVDLLPAHLELCLKKNRQLREHWISEDGEMTAEVVAWLDFEFRLLERRHKQLIDPVARLEPVPDDIKEWWSNWID